MMTNDQIANDIIELVGAIARQCIKDVPTKKDEESAAAAVAIIGASLGLLSNALQNLNDIARYCRGQTPPGAI